MGFGRCCRSSLFTFCHGLGAVSFEYQVLLVLSLSGARSVAGRGWVGVRVLSQSTGVKLQAHK